MVNLTITGDSENVEFLFNLSDDYNESDLTVLYAIAIGVSTEMTSKYIKQAIIECLTQKDDLDGLIKVLDLIYRFEATNRADQPLVDPMDVVRGMQE